MSQQALNISFENPTALELLNKLNDQDFIMKFAENPYDALEESGINLTLSEFTTLLSEDKNFYNLVVTKISEKVDTSKLNVAASSCCNSATQN